MDCQIHILDNLTWKPVAVFEFQARVPPKVVSKHGSGARSDFDLTRRMCGENLLAGWRRLTVGGSFPVGNRSLLPPST